MQDNATRHSVVAIIALYIDKLRKKSSFRTKALMTHTQTLSLTRNYIFASLILPYLFREPK